MWILNHAGDLCSQMSTLTYSIIWKGKKKILSVLARTSWETMQWIKSAPKFPKTTGSIWNPISRIQKIQHTSPLAPDYSVTSSCKHVQFWNKVVCCFHVQESWKHNWCLPQITAWFSCNLCQLLQFFKKPTFSHLLQQGSNILCHPLNLPQPQ